MTIDNPPLTVAVLGTGLIGAPVARNLSKHGFRVNAWNRTATKAQALEPDGVQAFANPADAVRGADLILTLLKDGPSVLEAMRAAAPALSKGALWLQSSTVGIEDTATLAAFAAERGLVFYDAPVQGTRQPAEQGQLIILASGPVAARTQVQPLFDAIGKRTLWVSEQVGASSRLKLALNSWAFALTHGIAESLAIAKGLGIDPSLVVDVVKDGPMDSGYFRLKAAAILADDYTTQFLHCQRAERCPTGRQCRDPGRRSSRCRPGRVVALRARTRGGPWRQGHGRLLPRLTRCARQTFTDREIEYEYSGQRRSHRNGSVRQA